MLMSLAILLLFQCLGEGLVFALGLPVPGPVVGMVLLFIALLAWPKLYALVEESGNQLVKHLSLLFVPAGVGVMLHVHRVADEWLAIVTALVGSTVLTIVLTAVTIKTCARWWTRRRRPV